MPLYRSPRRGRLAALRGGAECLAIVLIAYLYAGSCLLDMDAGKLQQNGEHNEAATLPLLAEIALRRYHEVPLWNPYMLSGFPHAGDPVSHFWNPVSTLAVAAWGGINGMKISAFASFVLAGLGQWVMAHVFGLRGLVRLWAALLFMLSGGLALLWRVGWYSWLLGMVWMPWCYGTLWWALHGPWRRAVVGGVAVAMVLTAGGGYYPAYLGVTMTALVAAALALARAPQRPPILRRAGLVAVTGIGLSAVSLVPLADGLRFTARDAPPDVYQTSSQPVTYALINYVVAEPAWFNTEILGTAGGWNWFYIGPLPLVALALVPLAFSARRARRPIVALCVVTGLLLLWHANRHTPFGWLYEWLPLLYMLRFPGRLLVVATSPLVVVAGVGLQHAQRSLARAGRTRGSTLLWRDRDRIYALRASLASVAHVGVALVLVASVADVFRVNSVFAFQPHQRLEDRAFGVLRWLKAHDPGLYYTRIGDAIYWSWTPAAYLLEMPVLNFQYNRRVVSQDAQRRSDSPLVATAKYQIVAAGTPSAGRDAQLIHRHEDLYVWHDPGALPFAFSVPADRLQRGEPVTIDAVVPLTARLAGTNRVVVEASLAAHERLVLLVSDYPGWRLYVDGRQAPVRPANGYLGADGQPGRRTYTFVFRPPLHLLGLAITVLTIAATTLTVLVDASRRRHPR